MINRAALVVIPKDPYVEWANALEEGGPKLDVDDPDRDHSVYLVDDMGEEEGGVDVDTVLRPYYQKIFELELAAWDLDEETWPNRRDFRAFKAWFEVRISSVVIDLCGSPIENEGF